MARGSWLAADSRLLISNPLPFMIAPFFFIHVFVGGLQDGRYTFAGFGYPMLPQGDIQSLDRKFTAYLTADPVEFLFFYMLPDDDELVAADAEDFTALPLFEENQSRITDETVAAGIALFIIRLFEVIDVGKEDAHTDLAIDVLLIGIQGIAVGHARHLVDEAVVAQLIDMVAVPEQHQDKAARQAE